MSEIFVLQYSSSNDNCEPVYGVYSSKEKALELNPTLEFVEDRFGGYYYTTASGFRHAVYLQPYALDESAVV